MTLGFDAWGIIRAGRPFHQQPHASRLKQVEAWRSSPIGLFRDFIRFYESLVVFGGYSMRRERHSGVSRVSASEAIGID